MLETLQNLLLIKPFLCSLERISLSFYIFLIINKSHDKQQQQCVSASFSTFQLLYTVYGSPRRRRKSLQIYGLILNKG